jgi:hypothetical protein
MIDSTPVVAVQVNSDNSLLVTNGVDYDKDGVMVGGEITSQYTLVPGDSLDGQPTEVVKIANALWTPAVVEAYKLAHPAPVPPPQPVMIVPPMLPQVTPVLVTQADSEPSSAQEIVADQPVSADTAA